MILLLFVRASVGTAEAVPFPVIRFYDLDRSAESLP
jgi:hypothetical protein